MKRPGRSSFRQYSLRHEWLAGTIGAALLIGAAVLSFGMVVHRYFELQQIESSRVKHHLEIHIEEASQQLQTFLQLPPALWEQQAEAWLPFFSDVYILDEKQQVREVIKATPGSRVFAGFSFAGSAIGDHLRSGQHQTSAITPILRGLEDELTSLYMWHQLDGQVLLARVQLSYIRTFLTRYSAFSGTPTLLVNSSGFVLLSGLESLFVATIDTNRTLTPWTPASRHGAMETLQLGGRSWRPVISRESILGARIVTLLPAEHLAAVRQVLIAACSLLLVALTLIFTWKNQRLGRYLFTPLARFTEQISSQERRLRLGLPPRTQAHGSATAGGTRIRELEALYTSFGRLISAISQRDQALLRGRERERQNEERQRQLLQSKLRSSLMAASVAHEINLPLATIRLLCRQAREPISHGASSMGVNELVSALSLQSQKVNSVMEKMRMLLHNIQTDHQAIDPVAVVLEACKSIEPLVHEFEGELEICDLASPPAGVLLGDAVQLQLAIINLLRNGIEAAGERRSGQPQLRVSLFSEASELVIEISDSGPGFRFMPSEDTLLQTSKASGSGLGLFVVRTTVEHHQGRLSFGRCPQLGGARVQIRLPLMEPSDQLTGPGAPAELGAEAAARSQP